MARIDNLTSFLTDVAGAIKNKTGKTDAITPANFDTEIESIQSGGGTGQPMLIGYYSYTTTTTSYTIANATMKRYYGGVGSRGEYYTNNVTPIILYYVRDNYTLSDNLTLLAETDYFENAGAKQKLLALVADLDSTADYVVTQASSQRHGFIILWISNTDTPIVIDNQILQPNTNIPVETDDSLYIYGISRVVSGDERTENFPFAYNYERIKCLISNFAGDKKIISNASPLGMIALKCPFKKD